MEQKQLIINTNPSETRVALLANNRVAELFIERSSEQGLVGNIFKGVVTRVLPGMNSAFVDIGLDKSAFLFGGDVLDPESEKVVNDDEEGEEEGRPPRKPIDKVLRDGQQVIVQVSKEPLGTKGPRVTMYLTIPGRYLVLMPYFSHIGISRRIENEAERERLKELVADLLPKDSGIIIRTAARGVEGEHLRKDLQFLTRVWQKIEKAIASSKAPSLLYKDLDMIQKITRDLYTEEVTEIVIDEAQAYLSLGDFLEDTIPGGKEKLTFYADLTPVFDVYGVEIDLGRALGKRVELPSGGYLIIEQTEALTTFDVNTGRFVGKANAQQTIVKTNCEAVKKVVEQLRIRNIGGIIIVDFIDMEDPSDREKVYSALQEELKDDRARTNVLRISELGLVQMTRKRTSESLERKLLINCPYCEGRGRIKSVQTEAHDLLRELLRYSLQTGQKKLKVKVREDIRSWLLSKELFLFNKLKNEQGLEVVFEDTNITFDLLREAPFEVLLA